MRLWRSLLRSPIGEVGGHDRQSRDVLQQETRIVLTVDTEAPACRLVMVSVEE